MRTPNNKNLQDFREVPLDEFNRAVAKYHARVDIKTLTDSELWVLYTKWLEVDTQIDARTSYAAGLRLTAQKYLDALKAECLDRGILS